MCAPPSPVQRTNEKPCARQRGNVGLTLLTKLFFLLLLALFNLLHVLKMVRASAVDLNLWPFEMLAVFVSESVSSRHPPKQIFIGA